MEPQGRLRTTKRHAKRHCGHASTPPHGSKLDCFGMWVNAPAQGITEFRILAVHECLRLKGVGARMHRRCTHLDFNNAPSRISATARCKSYIGPTSYHCCSYYCMMMKMVMMLLIMKMV